MPRVKFQVPDDLTKDLADASKRIYKAHLNKIAAAGYKTREELLTHQKEVCKVIFDLVDSKFKRRVFLSAVFWILHEVDLKDKQVYYDEFQKCKNVKGVDY